MLTEALVTTRAVLSAQASTPDEVVVRADSAFYSKKFIAAARRAGVRFSVTIPMSDKVRATIATMGEDGWVETEYPHPIWDEDQRRFISRAQVAETTYTAFTSRWQVTARLIARRVPDERHTTADDQGELFPVWRYHAVFTDSPFVLVQAEQHHRAHAIVEQLFAELIDSWPTYPRAASTPTTPGSPASAWPTTSPAPSPCTPAWAWPEPEPSAAA